MLNTFDVIYVRMDGMVSGLLQNFAGEDYWQRNKKFNITILCIIVYVQFGTVLSSVQHGLRIIIVSNDSIPITSIVCDLFHHFSKSGKI